MVLAVFGMSMRAKSLRSERRNADLLKKKPLEPILVIDDKRCRRVNNETAVRDKPVLPVDDPARVDQLSPDGRAVRCCDDKPKRSA